jgi:Kef-type K+ transport system membrane component KefB
LASATAAGNGSGPVPPFLLILVLVLLGAKLAGELASRLGQPSVLGELLVGVLLGNLMLVGGPDLGSLARHEAFEVFAELGAILLLFQVGLVTNVQHCVYVRLCNE